VNGRDGRERPDLARRAGRAFRRLTSGAGASAKRSDQPRRKKSFFRRIVDDVFWLVVALIVLWVIINIIAHLRG